MTDDGEAGLGGARSAKRTLRTALRQLSVATIVFGVASSAAAQLADPSSPTQRSGSALTDETSPAETNPGADPLGEQAEAATPAALSGPVVPPAVPAPTSGSDEPRSWLAPPQEQPQIASSSSPSTTLLLVLLLGATAAGAYWLKKKRGSSALEKQLGQARVHVLASSRIGPKANAVAIEFADQVLLLGVTETNVSVLQSLDKNAVSLAISTRAAGEQANPAPSPSASFRNYLDASMGRDPEPSAAERLAELTADRANVRARPARELVDIEGQAAGLAARLKKRTWEG